MKRRDFVTLIGAIVRGCSPRARRGQCAARLGVLMPSSPDDQEVKKE